MRKVTAICGMLAAVILNIPALKAAEAVLTGDTYVSPNSLDSNYGASTQLHVGRGDIGLLQFDTQSVLPANVNAANVQKATLMVFVNKLESPANLTVAALGGAWSEGEVTFRNKPSTLIPLAPVKVLTGNDYVAIDITAIVQDWVGNPALNFGVELTSDNPLQIDSKENTATSHPARLLIELANTGPAGPQGPMGLPGPTGTQGPAGSPGISGYQIIGATSILPSGFSAKFVNANCPAGLQVIAGGCDAAFGYGYTSNSDTPAYTPPSIIKNTPIGNSSWNCTFGGGTGINMPIAATAICAVVH